MGPTKMKSIPTSSWTNSSLWLNPPPSIRILDSTNFVALVSASPKTDLWRRTSYGFTHDSAHALLAIPLEVGHAVEVCFSVSTFSQQFDQAGLLVRKSHEEWVKAGVEVSDGVLQASAVATYHNSRSDWSVAPWKPLSALNQSIRNLVTIRVSRGHDSLTFRIRFEDQPFQLLRLCPTPGNDDAPLFVGPYLCSPTRTDDGLMVEFISYLEGEGDSNLHAAL